MQDALLLPNSKNAVQLIIAKHLNMINFARKMDQVYSDGLFCHFVYCTIEICLAAYTILTVLETNSESILKHGIIIFVVIFVIGGFCTAGEYLQSKSLSIVDDVYFLPWYELKPDVCKMVVALIQRAQIPISLTAGKFVILSNSSFLQLLKAAFSYLSVLRRIQQ
ncbi:odorant receptor 13a-like isoform X2 [Belonocnema kinseyi]|uniref:odorant receptor 13a-like isoform X2 n=1 Tax=Belonocnema kinseyi TaxID=2817044 RepID=UPI00143CFDBB|nr:odorant receptor 13a-like isoform X2 [Belonocnema kinseyi]